MDFAAFAITELDRLEIPYKIQKNNIGIKCPNPDHGGTKLNCYINVEKDYRPVHCFVCGYKGTWNGALVRDLGVTAFDVKKVSFDARLSSVEAKIKKLKKSLPTLPLGIEPWRGTWRTLSEDFLLSQNASLFYDLDTTHYRIVFPMKRRNVLLGYAMARLDQDVDKNTPCLWLNDWRTARISCIDYSASSGSLKCSHCANNLCSVGVKAKTFPKVINSDDMPSTRILYPFNGHSSYAIIVEGLYDALRLRALGFSAYSNLGTNTWSEYKTSLLLSVGVRRVYLMFDGDNAGYDSAREIRRQIKNTISTTLIDLPPNYDPGNLPPIAFKQITALLDTSEFIPYYFVN